MTNGVLHDRLDDKCRDEHIPAPKADMLVFGDAVLAKASMFEAQVTPSLFELTGKRDELVRALERLTIEDRELAKEIARTRRVRARERRDGVDGVEQKVRVDLRL